MTKDKIGILGWYGHGNAGDESYKLSFPKMFPGYECVFVEKTTNPDLKAFILGGGDIVNEHFLSILKNVENKHIMSAAVSKPMKLDGFKTIAVRDMLSIANAAESGIAAQYVPDFAFMLNFDRERGKELIQQFFRKKRDLYEKVVVVVLNAHLLPEHGGAGLTKNTVAFDHLSYQLAHAIDNTSASFIFLPFGLSLPWDDRVANAWVASKCKFYQKNAIVYDSLSVQDTIDIISAADGVVSTRLHSSIFSCVTGVPFIDITHNHKNKGFLDTIGMSKLSVPYGAVNYDVLVERLRGLVSDNNKLRDELNKVTARQRMILKEFSQEVKIL